MVGEMCFESAFDFVDSTFDSGDTSSDSGEVNSVAPFVPSQGRGLFGRVAIELARGGDGSGTGLRAGSFCFGRHALFLCERRGVGGGLWWSGGARK